MALYEIREDGRKMEEPKVKVGGYFRMTTMGPCARVCVNIDVSQSTHLLTSFILKDRYAYCFSLPSPLAESVRYCYSSKQ